MPLGGGWGLMLGSRHLVFTVQLLISIGLLQASQGSEPNYASVQGRQDVSWQENLKKRLASLPPHYTLLNGSALGLISDLSPLDQCLLLASEEVDAEAAVVACSLASPRPSKLGCAAGIGWMGHLYPSTPSSGAPRNTDRSRCYGSPGGRPGLRARLASLNALSPHRTFQWPVVEALASGKIHLFFLGDSSNHQAAQDMVNCGVGVLPGHVRIESVGRRVDDRIRYDTPFNFTGSFKSRVEVDLSAISSTRARTIIIVNFGLHYALGSVRTMNPFKNVSASWSRNDFLERFRRDVRGFGEFISELLLRHPGTVVLWHGSFSQHFDTPTGEYEAPPEAKVPRSRHCVSAPQQGVRFDPKQHHWRDLAPRDEVLALDHPNVYFLPLGRLTREIPNSVHPGYPDCTHLCKAPFAWEPLWWAITEIMDEYAAHSADQ